jgi:DNA-binding response OmpR family regulator
MEQTEEGWARRHRDPGGGGPLDISQASGRKSATRPGIDIETHRSVTRADQPPLRVLIADDYVDAAKSLALVLSIAGIEAEVAMDGEAALACAIRWRPQVCVLDMLMPKLDGREVARRVREQAWGERPLLIALTGRTTAEDRHSAREAGFDHYLTKPANPATLVQIIQNYRMTTASLGHASDDSWNV